MRPKLSRTRPMSNAGRKFPVPRVKNEPMKKKRPKRVKKRLATSPRGKVLAV